LERAPIVEAIKEREWEIVAHNYEQGELLCDYADDPDKEREVILRTLQAYEDAIGKPARGWLSSSLRGTVNTCSVLAEQGLVFFCDIMNDDQPYLIEAAHGNIGSGRFGNFSNMPSDWTVFGLQPARKLRIGIWKIMMAISCKSVRLCGCGASRKSS
jgi:allantoinase